MKGISLPPADQLIAEPAASGLRRVAMALLDCAIAAQDRLDDPADTEALHDFRVALRRLRSWIKAFDDELRSSVRKKHRRQLTEISRAAGTARDAQVHAAWLRDIEDSLRPRERPGAEWLLRRIVDHQREADAALRAVLAEQFQATAAALAKDLSTYTVEVDLRQPVVPASLREAMAPRVLALAHALGDRLAAVHSLQDQAVAHAARIAGKRLRYVLEPVAAAVDGGPPLIKRLRLLQEVIGEMHDVHVVAEDVIQAAEEAGADQARRVATALLEGEAADDAVRAARSRDPRPGLLAIAAHLRARGQSAFRELEQQWLGAHAGDLTAAGKQIADRLAGRSTSEPPAADCALPADPGAEETGLARRSATSKEAARQLLAVAIADDEIESSGKATPESGEVLTLHNGDRRNGVRGEHTAESRRDGSPTDASASGSPGANPGTDEETGST
jgi:CHAD domain-containing protein